MHVLIGFLRHPLPENATQWSCGCYVNGIGGHFCLLNGAMRHAGKEIKPAGTNKTCTKCGQTAAIRVNMRTKEAKLLIDGEEQPGIFTNIPSPLCLGVTTHDQNQSVEIVWRKPIGQ
ncbi:hypothetical protein BLNAU_5270 [Blattamonas nauphoetae]|uniref:Uncharacterized protein n=1 Tax=Blattamonas nauphoetae TaxID=2049346 RepID=A0ABQ9Y7S1_9EUKA|nr:hypothetical protein BLNAU_5270 [Blattamonas nauphoetae]